MQIVPVTTPRPMSKLRATFVRILSLAFQSRTMGKAAQMKSVTMEATPWMMMMASTDFLEMQWPGTCLSQTLFKGMHCKRKAIDSGVWETMRKAMRAKRKKRHRSNLEIRRRKRQMEILQMARVMKTWIQSR